MIPMDMMGPIMFGALVIFMLIGYPVAFSLAAVGLTFAFIAIETGFPNFQFSLMQAMPERVFGIMSNDLLLAIPFFTFMGAILERCGLAEDMLEGMGQLFGPVRGGLAYAVIIVGAILGAITGTVAASVIAMGLISLPIMMRYGYNMRLATGVIAASGTITQLIPPSLVLVVLADQLGKSVGDMYAGAIGASIVQVALFCGFIALVSVVKPDAMPPLPREDLTMKGWPLYRRILLGMIPSFVLIFLVLGTILMGLATPTEAGAMGAVGAIVLAVLQHKACSRRALIAARIGGVVALVLAFPGLVIWLDERAPAGLLAAAATGRVRGLLRLQVIRRGMLPVHRVARFVQAEERNELGTRPIRAMHQPRRREGQRAARHRAETAGKRGTVADQHLRLLQRAYRTAGDVAHAAVVGQHV